ncbi:MAG: multiple sugar transport system permease protein [Chloroflexota bacterium]|jgi:multiple sugar transport system permease protein|nr:multiple sugar transport system permease protein [Chloroflexota bacterium]
MAAPSVARARSQPRFSGLAWRRARWGYVFIAPWIIGFLAFTAFPMIATFVFTFTNINLAQAEPLRFVGLKNYETLFRDRQVWDSLGITLKFAALALPVAVILPFLVALLLHSRHLRFSGVFRVLFFLPYVVPFVAGVFIWNSMLNPDTGWINIALKVIGVSKPPAWLEDPTWVYPGLVIMGVWGIGAGVIVYLAGLRGIPTDLYEAARIDGAGAWASLRFITVPMMTPVIFYTIVLAVVEVLQYFLVPLVLKNGTGEPGGSTMFYNLYLYKNFFTFQNMSYGATLAWVLFAISLVITLVLFGTARRWVYYAGEAR